MHQIFPKVNQVFAYHLRNFEVINSLMDSVMLRVDAEEQYERAINKSANKISQLQSEHPLYSKILFSFKSLINQRAHQIRHFKNQIAKQAQTLKNALNPIEEFMKSHLSELKNMEKQLKSNFDTLTKSKSAAEQKMKELDQKFILNQISIIYKQNIGLRKNSESCIAEQDIVLKSLEKDWENLRESVMKFETYALQRQKRIWQLDVKVQQQFVDFFKKLNVHQISLIRNIQYDIDTMIKKTDIFNWTNTNQFNNQFSIKTGDQLQQSFLDPFRRFKQALIAQDQIMDPKSQNAADPEKLAVLRQKLSGVKESEEILGEIRQNYPYYRDQVCEWIQSFRRNGQFKFQTEQFRLLIHVFRQFLKCAIVALDFECVQKTIIYGNSYFSTLNNRKRTVLDEIKGQKLLSDLGFWRFYLLWTIRQSIASCKAKEQRDIHLRNGVYTTLLSNSLAMVEWGLQKHSIKNLIGKLAKTYGSLTEVQVAQLLKVIETAYQNIQKAKKSKKE